MRVAVINAGSSSLKFKLFETETDEVLVSQTVENLETKEALEKLEIDFFTVDVIAHRVVHGGEKFQNPVIIDKNVIDTIEELIPLAPFHNSINLEAIRIVTKKAPGIKQVAVFDTAFHATMPKEAYLYALPKKMYVGHGIRKYGFHGSSHSFVMKKAADILGVKKSNVNLITLHLGNGASACAIENGKSIDTSMGFTPLEGLIMGSRSGDIDPAIILYMQRELGMHHKEVDNCLNKEPGLLGICNENDVRKILALKDEDANLAINMMVRRIQKYVGAYMALLGRVDAIVFTGGIGENSSYIREEVMKSKLFSDVRVLVIQTDEELEIVHQTLELLKG